jgi:hypothetical protein
MKQRSSMDNKKTINNPNTWTYPLLKTPWLIHKPDNTHVDK